MHTWRVFFEARLWNEGLRIPVKLPKVTDRKWLSSPNLSNDKIYVVLAVIAYFLDTITTTNTFRNKLKDLLEKYPDIDVTAMGFPKDCKNDPFWSGVSRSLSDFVLFDEKNAKKHRF